ncbi:MAG: DUF6580 family putative transport protein [Patescibacteria group bacterium]
MKKFYPLLFLLAIIIVSRLFIHLPNFVPVSAIALCAGVYLGKKWALILPLVGLFVSDLFLGFYSWPIMFSVYGSFALIGIMSWWLKKHKNITNIAAASLGSAVLFFVVTNFSVWAFSPWYEKSLVGLMYCFELALPFFRNTLAGDLFYVAVFFAIFELALNHGRVLKALRISKQTA